MPAGLLRGVAPTVLLFVLGACGGAGTNLDQVVLGYDGGAALQGNNPAPTPYQDPFAGAPAFTPGPSGGDGSHHAGEACMQQGCHASQGGGSEAPAFLIGGTVYKDYPGTTPAAGVEVRILDASGQAQSTYSGREGNFFIRSGSGGGSFPAVIGARDATSTRPMITALSGPAMGSCAQSSCHVAGGSPGAGSYYPIHVP